MKEIISSRFATLLQTGQLLVTRLPTGESGFGHEYYVNSLSNAEYQAWLSGVANLINMVAPPKSYYPQEIATVLSHENMQNGVMSTVVQRVFGVLTAAERDWADGLLRKIEYLLAAATFDDFLDHAAVYHKGGRKIEGAVLASAVLEDAVKKIATKNSVNVGGQSLEQLIDALTQADVFTPVKAKRIKAAAAVRNHALHAEWDKFDIKDAGTLINGVRELIENYL